MKWRRKKGLRRRVRVGRSEGVWGQVGLRIGELGAYRGHDCCLKLP